MCCVKSFVNNLVSRPAATITNISNSTALFFGVISLFGGWVYLFNSNTGNKTYLNLLSYDIHSTRPEHYSEVFNPEHSFVRRYYSEFGYDAPVISALRNTAYLTFFFQLVAMIFYGLTVISSCVASKGKGFGKKEYIFEQIAALTMSVAAFAISAGFYQDRIHPNDKSEELIAYLNYTDEDFAYGFTAAIVSFIAGFIGLLTGLFIKPDVSVPSAVVSESSSETTKA